MSASNSFETRFPSASPEFGEPLFYVRVERGVMGPMTESVVQEMIRAGGVKEGDHIAIAGDNEWIDVTKIKLVFESAKTLSRQKGVGLAAAVGENSRDSFFYHVSLPKIVVLSFCTLGFYQIYWFFRHWSVVKAREHSRINPWLRALFAYIFCFFLFRMTLIERFKIRGGERVHAAAGLAAVATLYCIISNWYLRILPDKDLLYGLIPYSALVMSAIQWQANLVSDVLTPGHQTNSRFTLWNWISIVSGSVFIALAIFGTYYVEE